MLRIVPRRRRTRLLVIGAVVLAGLAAFVLLYFAPQDLLINTSVNDPLPGAVAETAPVTGSESAHPPPRLQVLTSGRFHSGEHDTSGTASLLMLDDGRRYVRLENLDTSNGPAVRIWLSEAGAHGSDDTVAHSKHIDVGGLKANHGNQNYRIPRGLSLDGFQSVVIWCERFDVVFGAAPISV